MGLDMSLGKRRDLRDAPSPELADQLRVDSPVLNAAELEQAQRIKKTAFLSTVYPISTGPEGLQAAVAALVKDAEAAVRSGHEILVLTDKQANGLAASDAYIPPLLAVGAVHHHLINAGVRLEASIVAETAQAWSTHHIACLVGFGASAVHPYLLFQSVKYLYDSVKQTKMRKSGQLNDIPLSDGLDNV